MGAAVNLDSEVVLITGGAQGLGEAMARAYARAGAAVVIADINEAGSLALAESIEAEGGRALGLVLDVTDPASVRACVEAASTRFGFVSVLVNSAMFARYGPVEEVDPAILDRMLAVGLKGVLLMCQGVVPQMRDRKHGVIINISSVVGLAGVGYSSAYAALKGGTDAVTRGLAVELGADGIRVNSIAPSAIPTEMSRRTLDAKGWEERRRRTPLGVIGSVEDVAQAAVFLSSAAANFISGVILPVDGGFSMAAMIPGVDIAMVQRSRN
jgi:NAD(P)-dependent dehydrogenase (short-subunit alcohol dehydrogenase family)